MGVDTMVVEELEEDERRMAEGARVVLGAGMPGMAPPSTPPVPGSALPTTPTKQFLMRLPQTTQALQRHPERTVATQ